MGNQTATNLDRERLEFQRQKHDDDVRLAEARLRLDGGKTAGLSVGTATVLGALAALASANAELLSSSVVHENDK